MTKFHAFYSHAPQDPATEPDENTRTIVGDVHWGDTHDWWWWSEAWTPNAAELADREYEALLDTPDLAVCRVTFEVPDEVIAASKIGPLGGPYGASDDDPLIAFIDDIEWESGWLHPAVTVIRQNALSEACRRTTAARMLRYDAAAQ